MTTVLEARALTRNYEVSRGFFSSPANVAALGGVSFDLKAGKTLAVVGESGSGKSTLARLITMIEEPSTGTLKINGIDIVGSTAEQRHKLRTEVQIVFQNPYGSLNPRQTILQALEEPLLVNTMMSKAQRQAAAFAMMKRVGLRDDQALRYPHMFSGGQRQRIAIARALMLRPKILVLDEPVSALDVSVRAQVLNLLGELQQEFRLAYVFISHDLSVVKHIADDVMVMYLGRAVEMGSRDVLFANPQHPYTRALMAATPQADPERVRQRVIVQGELPSPFAPPPGCAFNPRCPVAVDRCRRERPELEPKQGRLVACFEVA